MDDIT